ncbi:MAG TPA: hypothetical protein VGH72_08235 [Pseudonocardia sp.]
MRPSAMSGWRSATGTTGATSTTAGSTRTSSCSGFRARDPAAVDALVRRHLRDNEAIAQEAIAPVR